MGTSTTNYGFDKPTVGADEDNWGDDYSMGDPLVDPSPGLNGNWEKADQLIKQLSDQITNLTDTVIPALQAKTEIQVGELYVSVSDTDPATTLGYGVWARWGEGRALVSEGDNGAHDWSINEERGNDTTTLSPGNMPAHTHGAGTYYAVSNGNHTHNVPASKAQPSGGGFYGDGSGLTDVAQTTSSDGAHTHDVEGTSGSAGSGTSFSNVQPSKAAYIWERTA